MTMFRALHPKNLRIFAKREGIIQLTGALYQPSTHGVAWPLVQIFKQALRKSAQIPTKNFFGFLRRYRCTPPISRFSPSQLLNGRQTRTKLDEMLPSTAHILQGNQTRAIPSNDDLSHPIHNFKTGR